MRMVSYMLSAVRRYEAEMHIRGYPVMLSKAQVLHLFELEPHLRLLHRPCNYGD